MDTSGYLATSTKKLTSALTAVKAILDNENATGKDVAGATEDLNKAVNALERKPDKAPLEKLLAKAGEYEEMKYTVATYDDLQSAMQDVRPVINDSEATQKEVDEAVADLQSAISNLKKCTKYVWRIRPYLYLEDDNHVGHDWSDAIYYGGNEVWGSFEVTKATGATIQITGKAVENDSIPDSGSGTLTLTLTDGNSASKTFYVRENRGRYSGYQAVWELSAECEIIGRE